MPEYINGSELVNIPSIENDEIINDFLSIGVTLLGAPQKMGKTFFCLQISNAIAGGEDFLGYKVNQDRVIYCALEDTKEKIKKRYETFGIAASKNIDFIFFTDVKEFNLENEVKRYKELYSNIKLVVIDTFAKMRNKNAEANYRLYVYYSLFFR